MANPNPNTEGLKPFQPGQSGNPGGKTAEQRKLEVEAAEMAARLRHRMLKALMDQSEVGDASALDQIKSDVLNLIKQSEDRAHGTPKATTELHGPENGPVAVVQYTVIDPPKRE